MLLKIRFQIFIVFEAGDETVVDKAGVGVEIFVCGEIFGLGVVESQSLLACQLHHKHKEAVVEFVCLVERGFELTSGVDIGHSGVLI